MGLVNVAFACVKMGMTHLRYYPDLGTLSHGKGMSFHEHHDVPLRGAGASAMVVLTSSYS